MPSKVVRNKKCIYCERKFGKAEHLKRHQRAHTGEKPFKCPHCGRDYARSDVLMRHVRNHHSNCSSQDASQRVAQDCNTWEVQILDAVPLAGLTETQLSNTRSTENADEQELPMAITETPWNRSTLPLLRYSCDGGKLVENNAADPFDGIQSWLAPDLSLAENVWDDLPQFEFGSITAGSSLDLLPSQLRQTHPSPPKGDISDERYAKIASLWPMKRKAPQRLIQSLWESVASYPEDNIFSQKVEAVVDESMAPRSLSKREESRWGMDESRRARLIEDCAPQGSTSHEKAHPSREALHDRREDAMSVDSLKSANFPSTQILDISLDIYFRRFHHLMPFIHEPTFSAQHTSSTLLFPMCLMGLTLLDSVRAQSFVGSHLTEAIERCRHDLVLSSRRGGQLGELLTALAATSLLLTVVCITPKQALAEHSRLLYAEAMNAAQRHGLFVPQEGQHLSSTVFDDLDSAATTKWKAWTKIESVKRLIVCLIMSDSFFSALDDHTPIVKTESLHFYFPCKNELFQAQSAKVWSQLIDTGAAITMPWMVPQLVAATLPPPSDISSLSLFGVFSTIWIRIAEAKHRHTFSTSDGSGFLTLDTVFTHDEQAASIIPLLVKVWNNYGETIGVINPNCEAFWHHLNISVVVDIRIFELASGREGAETAKRALEDVAIWSQTSAARRACIHAAQTFSIMSKRRPIDGTSYEAEIALVHAALVLGLYVFVMPQDDTRILQSPPEPSQAEPFELLDKVDWSLVGNEGFTGSATNRLDIDMLLCPAMCRAATFIRHGGPISFSGVLQRGGYASARRILLDYVYLLEEVGSTYRIIPEFCHVLRILSDALIDLDSGGAD